MPVRLEIGGCDIMDFLQEFLHLLWDYKYDTCGFESLADMDGEKAFSHFMEWLEAKQKMG